MIIIENLLEKLEGVEFHTAGTGTIYVYHNGLKVRISDHEPNYGAPNRSNDKCFYLQDACGTKNDIYDVVEQVAEYLEIEIKGALKGMFTKRFNEQMKRFEELQKHQAEQKKAQAKFEAEKEHATNKLKAVISENKEEVAKILEEAEAYGDLASNGKKRRERTRKFLQRAFNEKFGFSPIFSEVKELLNK